MKGLFWWRPVATVGLVAALLYVAGYALWIQDWKWGLPTPRPTGLVQMPIGSHVALPERITAITSRAADRPVFLHFFNPECPCSRFTEDHIRSLIRVHGRGSTFVGVIEPEDGPVDADAPARVAHAFGIPVLLDADGAIARAAGVYATPQAVIVTSSGALYYRGNYNTARYCTDARTEFARLALEHLLAGAPAFAAPREALVAYGCPLPSTLARPERPSYD
jgi:hypothetical protein